MAQNASEVLIDTIHAWGVDTFSGCRATASTASWRPCGRGRTRFASFRCGTRKRRRSWRAPMPNTPGGWASVWRLRAPAAFICSTDCTTRSWTASRCWRSPGMHFHDLIDTHTQQDVELDKLFMDVAVYNNARHGRRRTWRTWRIWPAARRLAYRGVAHITFPVDFQEQEVTGKAALASATSRTTLPTCARAARGCRPRRTCSGPPIS